MLVRTIKTRDRRRSPPRAFTLIELLVVVAVVALLIALVLPSLSRARETARAVKCLSNQRQIVFACRAYADENKGRGPALGEPYLSLPNWALVVQQSSGRSGSTPDQLYSASSTLVCPSAVAFYAQQMTRTYAANATGLAGQPGDSANYDDPSARAHVRYDQLANPSLTPMVFDSLIATPPVGGAPPATRTASVLDLRNSSHRALRLGEVGARFHGARRVFQLGLFDGSATGADALAPNWLEPLP